MTVKQGEHVSISPLAVVRNATLHDYARIKDYAELIDSELGAYSYVSQNSIVNKTIIGKFCSIGHGTYVGLWEHNMSVSTHSFYLYETSGDFVKGYKSFDKCAISTSIGNDVWLGANCVILKGCIIGDGAIVGAGSVVTRDVPPYGIAVGNPAKVVKYRFPPEEVAFLLKLQWWNASREILQEMVNSQVFSTLDDLKTFMRKRDWTSFSGTP
jgi:acetyltransferase-like isoleucine patch superfamily enzyme